MKRIKNIILLTLLFAIGLNAEESALEAVTKIVKRVMAETSFQLQPVPGDNRVDVELVNFRNHFGSSSHGIGYALSFIRSENDTVLNFGLSYSGDFSLWLNNVLVYTGESEAFKFKEIAYSMFAYEDTVVLHLKKGINTILIKQDSDKEDWKFALGELKAHVDDDASCSFGLSNYELSLLKESWLINGPYPELWFKEHHSYPPEKAFEPYYEFKNKMYSWQPYTEPMVLKIEIPENATYKRESPIEWHYANGTLMMGILKLYEETQNKEYYDFVGNYVNFTLKNLPLFEYQYHEQFQMRGSDHRIFRRSMLDDSSAPALPFAEYHVLSEDEAILPLVGEIRDYLMYEQVRLEDNTLCRPEPEEWTVWADDLFMSVPFLLRLAEIEKDPSYYDKVAEQIKLFYSKLQDSDGVAFHCYYTQSASPSPVKWDRANGWLIWALTEALTHIPDTHPEYDELLSLYKSHIDGLIAFQDEGGMWHQILDKPDSFLESSGTAMYILSMARAIRLGWLDSSYADDALKGWKGLLNNINDGIVIDISKGTSVSNDFGYYYKRKRFPNDPRGLGAVITAGVEIEQLQNYLKK